MSATPDKFTFKVVLLGEGCVGKTSLVLQYCKSQFRDSHDVTLQASFLTKRFNLKNNRVELHIWDTAGQERFHALVPMYYRDAGGVVLVYDITDPVSYQRMQNWLMQIRSLLGPKVPIIIVGNKSDLDRNRKISKEDAQSYATANSALFTEASAKMNSGVEQLFVSLAGAMLKAEEEKRASGAASGGAGTSNSYNIHGGAAPTVRRGVTLAADEDPAEADTSKSCC
ncbi:hypothetical protein H696_03121 [Fonticula alba]|uniref:Uncharacterized protein n=1 Tax=Fonticula alba TaxID=691883 RepID=A0A058Z919_FONAL|nr:hypothetical protein H696_03121 [Fonticula alba]KCV70770.1 hypothetical protein H696_03121 [Fonticula alba]|eukprot:XP_009495286.1 hypothetical protein H696_03121 [Fonticula alba]